MNESGITSDVQDVHALHWSISLRHGIDFSEYSHELLSYPYTVLEFQHVWASFICFIDSHRIGVCMRQKSAAGRVHA